MTTSDLVLKQSLSDVFSLPPDRPEIFEELQKDLVIRDIAVGETLMTEGDPSDSLFVLLQGRLTATRATPEGEAFLGEIRRGETIGETGIVMQAPRGATVRAARASTVAQLSEEAVQRLIARHPALALAIARTLIARNARDAGPRHPGFVPETLCLFQASPQVDLARVSAVLSEGETPVRIVARQDDLDAARAEIHEGERAGARVLILADGSDPDWLRMAVGEADEVVRVVAAGEAPAPTPLERQIERGEGDVLPRQTLLLIHPDATVSPVGTRAWLDGRRIDRHLHLRLGHAGDRARVARLLTGRAVGIVFAGGGARGAAHLGAVRALQEAGVEFDIVGGTSIGAAIAAWYAMGLRGRDLEAAACKVFVESGGPTSDWNIVPMLSLVKGRRTRDLAIAAIREATGHDIEIEDTWTPFFCISANYTAQEQAVLRRGPLWRALTATYAIPGVLPPVLIDGELYVDGGVMNNLPVDVLEEAGAAHTIAIDLLTDRKRALDLDALPSNLALLRDKLRPRRRRKYRLPGILSMLLGSTVLSSLNRQREMAERASLSFRPELHRVGLLDWHRFPEIIEQGHASISAQLTSVPDTVMRPLRGG